MINKIDKVKIFDLQIITSKGSKINVFENLNELFIIKRTFTVEMSNFELNERGRHAHKIDHQIVTCPFGSIEFEVNDGENKKTIIINNPSKAVYVPNHALMPRSQRIIRPIYLLSPLGLVRLFVVAFKIWLSDVF